jgi:hypothetical protein
MPESDVGVVLAHGAWADGSSWGKVIAGLRSEAVKAVRADDGSDESPAEGYCEDRRITTGPRWRADRHGGDDIR